jgi:hypothetical protein
MHSDKKNKPAKTLLTSKPKKRKDEGHASQTKHKGYAAHS